MTDLFKRLALAAAIGATTLAATAQEKPKTDTPAKPAQKAPAPKARLEAIRELSSAGVPVCVLVAPVIPALTDHEMPAILAAARQHGARMAGYVPLRLPFGLKDLFEDWLTRHFPDRRDKILNRIRDLRGGKLNDPNFNTRMRGQGLFADQIHAMFKLGCRKAGIGDDRAALSTAHFRPHGAQSLFD